MISSRIRFQHFADSGLPLFEIADSDRLMLRLLRLTLAVFPIRECGPGHESPVRTAAVCDHGDHRNRRLLSAVPLAETRQDSMVAVARSGESVVVRRLLSLHPAASGRVYAAYGGVYITVAICWLWLVDGVRPSRWDLVGVIVRLAGMTIIMLAPRT